MKLKKPKLTVAKSLLLPQHKEIEEKALVIFQKWGLTGRNNGDWEFSWSDEKTVLGRCWYQRKLITISRYYSLFIPLQENVDTILHEIAHALTWEQFLIDKKQVSVMQHTAMMKAYLNHGLVWELFCKQIGAKPNKCYNGVIELPDLRNAGKVR